MVAGTAALDMIPQFPASACRRDEILMEEKPSIFRISS